MIFDYTKWEPLLPEAAAGLFASYPGTWCIAGGWAIDLFLGKTTRPHGDTDILTFRNDQRYLKKLLCTKELFVVDPPGQLRSWKEEEVLVFPLYNIWCRENEQSPWSIQIMLEDTIGEEWFFRRDNTIKSLVKNLITFSKEGWPILSPEIQLLYKAKTPRGKDKQDFEVVLPHLSHHQKEWLKTAILKVYPAPHPWVKQLI